MSRLTDLLDQRLDGRALGIARIILGLAAFLKGLLTAASVQQFQSADPLRFPYPVLGSVIPAEGVFGTLITLFWLVFALFFMIGYETRVSGALLTVMIFLVIGIDQQFYSNHLYLLGTVVALMTIAEAGNRYSIDARRSAGESTVPRWAVLLIMLQLTSVYFFAGVTKLNEGFLSGRVMERVFEPSMRERLERVIALDTLAPLAIMTELCLAFAFWHSRTRLVALPVAFGFHVMNVAIMGRGGMYNLAVFALIMLSMMVVFFTPGAAEIRPEPAEEPAR